MALKESIYKNLSYTSENYDAIIAELVSMLTGSNSISKVWNNVSEADIMFIVLSLMAAHKDILNYMVDYRILETYMSTAKESASMARIAASFGYKIPPYKAARAQFQYSSVQAISNGLGTAPYQLKPFTQFTDVNGVSWASLANAVDNTINTGSVVELFQGVLQHVDFLYSGIDSHNQTHIINSRAVAIGNNYSAAGCSSLVVSKGATSVVFTEVENVYGYDGVDMNVYELNVDPQGITYVKFPKNLDLSPYSDYTFRIYYIVTNGALTTSAANVTCYLYDTATGLLAYRGTFTPVASSFYAGSNAATADEIREGFKNYYASADMLVTLEDYQNFILNIQKAVPGITKCLVADGQRDTAGGNGDSVEFTGTNIGIYAAKGTTALTAGEILLLDAEILDHRVSGIVTNYNGTALGDNLTNVDVYVKLNKLPSGSVAQAAVKQMIADYIAAKNIGDLISTSEIIDLIKASAYASTYTTELAVEVKVGGVTSTTAIQLLYNELPVCVAGNIDTSWPA